MPKSKADLFNVLLKGPTAKRKVQKSKSVKVRFTPEEPSQAALSFCSEKAFDEAVHSLFSTIPTMETAGFNVLLIPLEMLASAESILTRKGIKFTEMPIVSSADLSDDEWKRILDKQKTLPAFRDIIRQELEKEKLK